MQVADSRQRCPPRFMSAPSPVVLHRAGHPAPGLASSVSFRMTGSAGTRPVAAFDGVGVPVLPVNRNLTRHQCPPWDAAVSQARQARENAPSRSVRIGAWCRLARVAKDGGKGAKDSGSRSVVLYWAWDSCYRRARHPPIPNWPRSGCFWHEVNFAVPAEKRRELVRLL